jgi:hypothetical protein
MNVLFVKMKISKLINYSTNIVEVAKVLGHIVIGPHGIRKYHTTCCHVPQATQFEA